MAGRPKKTVETPTTEKDNSKEILAQLKAMQEQINKLQEENKQLKIEKETEDKEENINGDTEITVISQTNGKLVISTEGNGIGTVYRFEEFGEAQDIPFSDLKEIVKNKPRFAREGAYFIANENAIKKLKLTKYYSNIIDDKLFEHLFDTDSNVVIKAYENAPRMQQEQIEIMIQNRLDHKQEVDGNVLMKISRLSGKDFLKQDEEEA
jgi:hypothetical protein